MIKRAYRKAGHAASYSGLGNLHRQFPQLSRERIATEVSGIDSYTRHKEAKRVKHYNPYTTRVRLEVVQIDLLDVGRLSGDNDGVKYLLMIIDTFSRKAWYRPLKSKSGPEVAEAFSSFLTRELKRGERIGRVLCDKGTEFRNVHFARVLERHGAKLTHPSDHAPHVERLNRTIQKMIHISMTDRHTERYIGQLDKIFKAYNSRVHSAHKMSPNAAFKDENNEPANYNLSYKRVKQLSVKRRRPRFQVGDLVRIQKLTNVFSRSYEETHKIEIFRIRRVVTEPLPVPMYEIETRSGEETIGGLFYANELVKIRENSDFWKIERILRTRTRGGAKESYVKWYGYDPKYNSWVANKNLKKYK